MTTIPFDLTLFYINSPFTHSLPTWVSKGKDVNKDKIVQDSFDAMLSDKLRSLETGVEQVDNLLKTGIPQDASGSWITHLTLATIYDIAPNPTVDGSGAKTRIAKDESDGAALRNRHYNQGIVLLRSVIKKNPEFSPRRYIDLLGDALRAAI